MDPTPPTDDQGSDSWVGWAARRVVVTIAGAVVLLAGLVMIVTPGPGLVTIAAGLAILATEYDWARRALLQVRSRSRAAYQQTRARMQTRAQRTRPPR